MNLRTYLLPLPLLVGLAVGPASLADDEVEAAASFSNTLSETELAGWLDFGQRPGSVDRERHLEELMLVKFLATQAAWLGLDRRVAVQLEIELREAALAEAAMRRVVASSINLTEVEIEAKYQAIKDTFTLPRRVRLRNLYKRFPPDADEVAKAAVRAEMETLRRRAVEGQDFAALATAHSDSQTRFQGGLMGNVPAGRLTPEVDALAMTMRPGEVSEILSGPDGLTLLFCEKIVPKVERSPQELRDIAHQRLRNQTLRKTWRAQEVEWLAAARVVYRWPVVESDTAAHTALAVAFEGGGLSRRQLEALMAARRPLEQVPRQRIEQRVEAYLVARAAAQEIERRGLEDFEGLADRRLWARRKILASKASLHWVEQRFDPPTEAEARQYFEAQRQSFVRPVHFDLAAIQLPLPGDDLQKSFRQAERLVYQLESGELPFAEAAQQFSRHSSAEHGGRLGWVSRQILPHAYGLKVLKALVPMRVGEMSGLIQDGDDWWIFQLLAKQEERPMTWDEARQKAENRLGNERVRVVEAQLRQELVQRLRLEVVRP